MKISPYTNCVSLQNTESTECLFIHFLPVLFGEDVLSMDYMQIIPIGITWRLVKQQFSLQ